MWPTDSVHLRSTVDRHRGHVPEHELPLAEAAGRKQLGDAEPLDRARHRHMVVGAGPDDLGDVFGGSPGLPEPVASHPSATRTAISTSDGGRPAAP